ncbi:MAG: DoxX family membrane protein, partial [bacterium]
RLMLAATFLWAGAGKLFQDAPFSGESAAKLANLGVNIFPTRNQPAARPPSTAKNPVSLWPGFVSSGPWLVVFAWSAAMAQLFGGLMLLLGLFTRFFAAVLCCVMLSAMWLDQLGPAIWSGNTFLGVLPAYTWWDPAQWNVFYWQLALIASAFAVALLGSGAVALDNATGKGAGGSAPQPKNAEVG